MLEDFPENEKNDEYDWLNAPLTNKSLEKKESPPPVIEDDRPIKPSTNAFLNIDDMPVGVHKAKQEALPEPGKISFGIRD